MSTWLAQFEFAYPARLVWLTLLLVLIYFTLRGRATLPGLFRWLALMVRAMLVIVLVVAVAGPRHYGHSRQRFVVVATDVSRSVGGGESRAARELVESIVDASRGHRVAFLPFAGQVGQLSDRPEWSNDSLEPDASDPGEALRIATAVIPGDYVPQVVLLTDGNENRGELARAAYGVNLPVHVLPLPAFPQPEACIAELRAPDNAAQGLDVDVEVVVLSNHEDRGTLTITANETEIEKRDVTLAAGENRFEFRIPMGSSDEVTLEAHLQIAKDTIAENNRRRVAISARLAYRVLLVDSEPYRFEPFRVLLQQQRFAVTVVTPEDWEDKAGDLNAFDVCLLVNVRPQQITLGIQAALQQFIQEQGGGLIVTGGEATYGWESFRGSSLESMLPVDAVEGLEQPGKVLAMVLVIDRSTSMEIEDRMELAKRAAKQSVQVLQPTDKVGVIAFSDGAKWIAELAAYPDKSELTKRIDTLEPRGQTHMFSAVERAYFALEQTDADRKHMILVTDGIPAPGDYLEIAHTMADTGMTLSAVTISPGAERDLLQNMARIARGRYHHCNNPADVPGILVRETQEAAGHDEPLQFRPFALRALPGLEVATAPPLDGFAVTNLKADAEPLLYAVGGSPLLCWRRYGAGITAALTSDINNGGARFWMSWDGNGGFWKRLVRHAARPTASDPLTVTILGHDDSTTVTIDARTAAGDYDSQNTFAVRVTRPDGSLQETMADLIAPGRYAA